MQSIDSIETYALGTWNKEQTKWNKIDKMIKEYKKWLTFTLQKKTWQNIFETGHKFLITRSNINSWSSVTEKTNSLFNLISQQISTKLIYMLKIPIKENINC